jgi:hypothetical protein
MYLMLGTVFPTKFSSTLSTGTIFHIRIVQKNTLFNTISTHTITNTIECRGRVGNTTV